MQQQIVRADLLAAAVEGLSQAPVVALLGARQVGKTTLAGQVASAWRGPSQVFDLEVAAMREAVSAAPERLRRGQRWGFEFKCSDAPRTTKSMHIVARDLGLAHLWVVYPGDFSYPLAENITAWPLKKISEIGA